MKKILVFACIFAILSVAGCKKSEEKSSAQSTPPANKQQPVKPGPSARKRQNAPAKQLDLYNEKTLVVSVPLEDYPALTTGKIKVGKDDVNAIPLKDLLAKYKIQGRNVILGGHARSVPITWAQANSDGLYVYITPRNQIMIAAPKSLENISFPNRIVRITASASADAPAKPADNKKPGK